MKRESVHTAQQKVGLMGRGLSCLPGNEATTEIAYNQATPTNHVVITTFITSSSIRQFCTCTIAQYSELGILLERELT